MNHDGWIGVDLDGTLARYDGWNDGAIGDPIPAMVERVRGWIKIGIEVRIVTARLDPENTTPEVREATILAIRKWCEIHVGHALPAQAHKGFGMFQLWDDRAVAVERNTGRFQSW